MFDIYLLTRLAELHDICGDIFALSCVFLLIRGGLAILCAIDDSLFEGLAAARIWLRKFTWVAVVVAVLAGIASSVLPSRKDVVLMVGNEAANKITTAIEAK